MSAASIYEGQDTLIPVVNAFGNVFEEWQIAAAAQAVFILNSFQYTPGTNTLLVFKNGLFQRPGFDYLETNSTRITFSAPTTLNDRIAFFAFATAGVAIPNGGGVPAGGVTGQALVKIDNSDYNTQWVSLSAIAGLLDRPVQALAAANTLDLTPYALTTRNLSITGATTVAGFQVANGQLWSVRVAGTFLLTHSANLSLPNGQNIAARTGDSFFLRAFADNQVELLGYSKAQNVATPAGQCYLSKSGANIILSRLNGESLWINGTNEQIPATPIFLAPTGLTPGTLYYIYAYMNAGVMTLEASVTGAASQDAYGVRVKTGDATRTLVGMVRPITGPAFQDVINQRFVISYFNRKSITTTASLTVDSSTTSTTFFEISTALRNEFLSFGDSVSFNFDGQVGQSTINTLAYSNIALSGALGESMSVYHSAAGAGTVGNPACSAQFTPAEGYFYATLFGAIGVGGTATWKGSAFAASRCSLKGTIFG